MTTDKKIGTTVKEVENQINSILKQSTDVVYGIDAKEAANMVFNLPQLKDMDPKVLARAILVIRLASSRGVGIAEYFKEDPDKDLGLLEPSSKLKTDDTEYRTAIFAYVLIVSKHNSGQ